MDCLEAQSLIGIQDSLTEKKLTAVSPDVFISIPARDSSISHQYCVNLRLLSRLSHGVGNQSFSADLFNS